MSTHHPTHSRARLCDQEQAAIAQRRRDEPLLRENARLRHQLERANAIIDVQKKLCALLGLPTAGEQETKD